MLSAGGKVLLMCLAFPIPSPMPGKDGDGQQHHPASPLPLGCSFPGGPIHIHGGK